MFILFFFSWLPDPIDDLYNYYNTHCYRYMLSVSVVPSSDCRYLYYGDILYSTMYVHVIHTRDLKTEIGKSKIKSSPAKIRS